VLLAIFLAIVIRKVVVQTAGADNPRGRRPVAGRIDGDAVERRPGNQRSVRHIRRDGYANQNQAGAARKTIESIGDSVLVADEHGQIVVANAAAKRLLEIAPGAP